MTSGAWRRSGLLAAVAALAIFGPLLSGSTDAPAVASASARLLPPGTRVAELSLERGGFVRALEIVTAKEQLRLRSPDGWRSLDGVRGVGLLRSRRMWLGTDHQGRDLAARAIAGARTSLGVALFAMLVALSVGTLFGTAGAVSRRALSPALRLLGDSLLGLPRILLLLILGIVFGGGALGVGLAIGLASWMEVARLVESEACSILGREYAQAARASGAGPFVSAARHVLPNLVPVLVAAAPLVGIQAVLLESTLSFLGVGGTHGASWGAIIADGRRLLPSGWWVMVFPGILLTATALAIHAATVRTDESLLPRNAPSTPRQ